jgi:hypothetical protein
MGKVPAGGGEMSEHTIKERLRVAVLLPYVDDVHLNLPLEKKVYSRELADFLLDTEAETGALALAGREMNGTSTVVFEDGK